MESREGRGVVPVPPVPGHLLVEVDDSCDGGRRGDGSFSISPHSVGGWGEGAGVGCRRVGWLDTAAVPVAGEILDEEVKT